MQIHFQRLHQEEQCVAIWMESLETKWILVNIKIPNFHCLMWLRIRKARCRWTCLMSRSCRRDLVPYLADYMESKQFLVFMLSDQGGSGHGIHYNCNWMEELMAIGLYVMEELMAIGLYVMKELMAIGLYVMEELMAIGLYVMEELMEIGLYVMEELMVIGLCSMEELMVIGICKMRQQKIGSRYGDHW